MLRMICYIDFKCSTINFHEQWKHLTKHQHLGIARLNIFKYFLFLFEKLQKTFPQGRSKILKFFSFKFRFLLNVEALYGFNIHINCRNKNLYGLNFKANRVNHVIKTNSVAICGCLKCSFSSSGSFGFCQTFA